jgi:hypothetical protein
LLIPGNKPGSTNFQDHQKEITMSWTGVQSLDSHKDPREYLDAFFESQQMLVLASTTLFNEVYYAAVECIDPTTEQPSVFAAICLYRCKPNDPQGFIFEYKDMSDDEGPVASDCPAAILDLLTPTTNETSNEWRERCRLKQATGGVASQIFWHPRFTDKDGPRTRTIH